MVNTEKDKGSLGHILAGAREKMGVSVEEAARETRIHVDRIRDMEGDKFYEFSHPSYARMFLRDYARYLNVPQEQLRGLLPDSGECMSDGLTYITRYSAPENPVNSRRKRGGALFVVLAAALLALGGYQIWKAATAPVPVDVTEVESTASEMGEEPELHPGLDEDLWFLSQPPEADVMVDIEASETTFSSLIPEGATPAPVNDAPLQINPSSEGANP